MNRQLSRTLRALVLLTMLSMLSLALATQPLANAQVYTRYFPETQHYLSGLFFRYWNAHGGLAQQGYPITEEFQEQSDLDGNTYTVQYFERAVFEQHPEFVDTPNEVLLSQLGTFELKNRYSDSPPASTPSADNPYKFPQTGHAIGGKFRAYWEKHGGLAQQGYPITDEFQEVSLLDGKKYTVQYFERAVFELHPEFAGTPNEVLLSQLGKFELVRRYPNNSNPGAAPQPSPTPAACPSCPYDGMWEGQTSYKNLGTEMNFIVTNDKVTQGSIGVEITNCPWLDRVEYTGSGIPITNKKFSSLQDAKGAYVSWVGTFNSKTTASGTFEVRYTNYFNTLGPPCTGSQSTTWTASKVFP